MANRQYAYTTALVMFLLVAQGQPRAQAQLWLDDPRPMAQAAERLEREFAWIITYEDPPFQFAEDLRDVTVEVRKDLTPGSPRVLIPNSSPFAFSYVAPPGNAVRSPEEALQALVEAYVTSGNSGAFRVIGAPPMYHLVPTRFNDVHGASTPYESVLEAKISLPSGRRSLFAVMEEIAAEVTRATGTRVVAGAMPLNFAISTEVEGGAEKLPARAVLRRILSETGRPVSWQMFFDPGGRGYALHLHIVSQSHAGQQ